MQDASETPRAKKHRVTRAVVFTLNLLSRLIASIFTILFVVTTLLTLILFNVGRQLFEPGLYKSALVEQHIYQEFPALVARQMAFQLAYAEKYAGISTENMTTSPDLEACLRMSLGDEAFKAIAGFERQPEEAEIEQMRLCFGQYGEMESESGGGAPPGLASLTPADLEAMISMLIPEAWLQAQAESAIDQAFAALDSADPTLPITISLLALREHLAGGAVMEALLYAVRKRPPCTDEQLALLASQPLQDLPMCHPPEDILNKIAQEGAQVVSQAIGQIPDQAALSSIFGGEAEPSEGPPAEGSAPFSGDNPRQSLRRIRWVLILSPLIPALLLLLVTLFGVRSRQGVLRWWGFSFLVAGLAGLGLAVAALPALDWAIATYLIGKLPPTLSPTLAQTGLDVGRYIIRALVTGIRVEAALITLAGVLFLLGLFFVRPKRN